MKPLLSILCAFALAHSAQADGYAVGRLPYSNSPTAEASTNVAFHIRQRVGQTCTLQLAAYSVSSNAVQVAFGTDADGDGDLAAEEADLVLGLNPGLAFIENVAEDARTETTEIGSPRFLEMTLNVDRSHALKSCAFTNETGACFTDVSSACPSWLFNPEWNLFKVIRRGAYNSNESIHIEIEERALVISVK